MKVRACLTAIVILSVGAVLPAFGQDEILKWNTLALDALKNSSTNPPQCARDLAIVHIAAYDALSSIDRTTQPVYAPWQNTPSPADRVAAVAAAAHRALSSLYPQYQATFDAALNESLNAVGDPSARTQGVNLGTQVADSVLAWRSGDGWNAASTYTPVDEIGHWRPTPPNYTPPLAPQWGNVTPFALVTPDAFMPPPPPALTSPEYAAAFNEVKDWGGANSALRTADQDEIAAFWNDFPGTTAAPAGKWNLIGQELAVQQQTDMARNARMFALMNLALADAGIVCWKAKYDYDLWRPIDAIRMADQDNNPGTDPDTEWEPNWPTPPFPEYTSGHSTFSGAGAEILALVLGTDNIPFTLAAGFDVLPGVTRSYDTISDAALEAGMSRIYGGIHFQFANVNGLACGSDIARYVFETCCLPVPEPATLLFFGFGVLALKLRRKTVLK